MKRLETWAELATVALLCALAGAPKAATKPRAIAPFAIQSLISSSQSSSGDQQGDFVLHFLQHAIGNEHYELKSSADRSKLTLDASFEYTDRGVKVPLHARLEMQPDFTPEHFEIKGKSYRYFNADAAVDIAGTNATVRDGQESRQVALPGPFFTVDGYSPISVQAMMMRYWLHHGRPAHLMALPAGDRAADVTIALAGHDTVNLGGQTVMLDRYTVNNVVWGRESAWLLGDRLVAITTYTGGLAFEAVSKEFDWALPQFIRSEVADRMKDLAAISKSVPPLAEGSFAIVGATLIDGTGRASVPDSVVIVQDGKIAAAGARGSVQVPAGIRKIDARGLTLLPGLWEMHAHYAQIEWGPAYLASGVTTARDCGNEFEFITAVRDEIAQHAGLGPRLLLAGLIDGAGPDAFGVNSATTPEEGRALVNRYKKAGFSQIKIYNLIQPDVLRAITAEAHRLGMTVTGHIPNGMNAFDGVNDGMDQINHIGYAASVMRAPGRDVRFDAASPKRGRPSSFIKNTTR